MITLAAPCRALMEHDPLTVTADSLLADVSEQIKEIHYGAAVAVDAERRPVGLLTRSDLVAPPRRRVLLVDHAEQAQSVPGIEQAEIVEILDHHHIGSIETRVPVTATFDPVGSTATLVIERFRQNGMEPSRSTAMMLLGRGPVGHRDPQLADDDRARPRGRRVPRARAGARRGASSGARCSRRPPTSPRSAPRRSSRATPSATRSASGQTICIAQIEVVGESLLERKDELLEAMRREREDAACSCTR